MSGEELKACPLCGKALYVKNFSKAYAARCDEQYEGCGFRGPIRRSHNEAIRAVNRRVPTPDAALRKTAKRLLESWDNWLKATDSTGSNSSGFHLGVTGERITELRAAVAVPPIPDAALRGIGFKLTPEETEAVWVAREAVKAAHAIADKDDVKMYGMLCKQLTVLGGLLDRSALSAPSTPEPTHE